MGLGLQRQDEIATAVADIDHFISMVDDMSDDELDYAHLVNRRSLLQNFVSSTDPDEFWKWLREVLRVTIPRYQVCPHHGSPFEYFCDRVFEKVEDTLLLANRSGSKSWMAGGECWLKARYKELWEANILGASKDQSRQPYEATQTFWRNTEDIGSKEVILKQNIQETKFKNGSAYRILAASAKSVRHGHPQTVFLDEIDEMDRDIFEAALFQAQAKEGHVSSMAMMSTRHKVGGLMAEYVETAEERGLRLYTHCVLEVAEPCYGYNCSTCLLSQYCDGWLKKAYKKAEKEQQAMGVIEKGEPAIMGYFAMEDIMKRVRLAQEEITVAGVAVVRFLDVAAEYFCQRPSKSGLVYKIFDENLHVMDDKQIKVHPAWRKYRMFDFGFAENHPFVRLKVAINGFGHIFIYDEYIAVEKTLPNIAADLLELDVATEQFEFSVGDPSDPSAIKELGEKGIPIMPGVNDIVPGIRAVSNLLSARDTEGRVIFHVSTACPFTIGEFLSYRYPKHGLSNKPQKGFDHAMDALRYWAIIWMSEYFRDFAHVVKQVKTKKGITDARQRKTAADGAFEDSKKDLRRLRRTLTRQHKSDHRKSEDEL